MRVGFAPMVCLQVCFEVKITKNLPTDFGDDHEEADPHVVRVGWSVDSHGFQLGITNRKNIFNQKELHRYMISIGSGRALFSAIKTTWICYCPKDDSFQVIFFLRNIRHIILFSTALLSNETRQLHSRGTTSEVSKSHGILCVLNFQN